MKRTILAAGLAVVVTVGLTVATAPVDAAEPATVGYACQTSAGRTVTMNFAFEADAPSPPEAVTLFRSPQSMNMRMESAVPGALAKSAVDDGATTVGVLVTTSFSDAYPSPQPTWRTSTFSMAEPVALGDQSTPTDRPYVGRGIHRLMQPGVNDLRPGDLQVSFSFKDSGGAIVGDLLDLTCTTPSTPVVDTVWVQSVTFLDLLVGTENWNDPWKSRTYSYGEMIPVKVRVSALGTRTPGGWVDVTLDGVTRRVTLDAAGKAAVMMPGPVEQAGYHAVSASFVPADPIFYGGGDGSRPPGSVDYFHSVQVSLTSAATRSRVRVAGKRAHRKVRVHVRVRSEFASTPAGRVRVNLRKLGTRKHWTRSRKLHATRARAGFGKLPHGRYRVVVKYRGDANHLRSRKVKRFRVR